MTLPSQWTPTLALKFYEAAKSALAKAARIDEVKDIHDRAVALKAYAAQAKDSTMIDSATEIRMRAERRAGEMLRIMAENGERDRGYGDRKSGTQDRLPKLRDLGVAKWQSMHWQNLAKLDDIAFEEKIARAKKDAVASIEMTAGERMEAKRERRGAREAALADKIAALPDKKFGVIYADPPWRFEPYSRVTGMDRAADNHYPTMDLDAIFEIPIGRIAADDCALFLWATAPMLPQALRVVEAWGFAYRTHLVWVKDRIGTGYWFRSCHELLLVATRGDVPGPAPGTQWESVVESPVKAHSEKPLWGYQLVEIYFPTLPRIELFARSGRAGWETWGKEAPAGGQ